MGFKFNPLAFSGFDLTSAGGPGYVLPPVPNEASLPVSATDGFHIVVLDTDHIYVYDGTTSKWVDTGLTAASFGITPNSNGYTIQKDTSGSIVRNKLILQPADATNPGGVSTTVQTFAGDKTFNDDIVVQGDLTVNGTLTYINTTNLEVKDKNIVINKGGLTISTGNAGLTIEGNGAPVGYSQVSSDTNKWELKAPGQAGVATINPGAAGITLDQSSHDPVTLAAVGATPNANAASLSNQQLTLQPADGTNPGVITAGTQTLGGAKTFNDPVTATINYTPADATDWLSPAPTTVAGGLDALADKIVQYNQITKEPTGFPNITDSSTSFVDGSRLFTIQPTGVSFDVYVKGKKFTKSSAESITIPNLAGNHYIYYNDSGALSSTQVLSATLFSDNALVSVIYWNTDTNTHTYFAEERHGLVMDGATHTYLHTVFGTRYLSGLALQNFSVNGDGNSNAHAQFTSDSGAIRDEDLLIQILAQTQIPILYRQGQLWRKKAADAFPVIYSGTAGYTGANGRLPYNQFTGGSWQLTEVGNTRFVLLHVFATNDKENPVVGIQGIAEYIDVSSARNAANSEITSLSGLVFTEFAPLGSVVFETANGYANTPKARIRSVNGGNYVDFRGTQLYTPAGNATTHSLLSGLANDDHIQYLLADGTRSMTGNLTLANNSALKLAEATVNGLNTVTLKSPSSLAADYTLTLPADDGLNYQFLKTDGSGNLNWEFPKNNGKIYHVSADGRSEYTTIQSAINAAEAATPTINNPQFIVIHGNFTEDLTISKTGICLIGENPQTNYFSKINGSLTINKTTVLPGESATNSLIYINGLYFTKTADNFITITGSNPQRILFENCSFAESASSLILINNTGTNSKTSFKDCNIQIDASAVKVPVTVSAGWADFNNCFVSNTSAGGTSVDVSDGALVSMRFCEVNGIMNFTATSTGVISVSSITTTLGAAINNTSSNILGVAVSNLGITVPAATSGITGTGYLYHTNIIYGGLGGGFSSTVNAIGLNIEMGNIKLPNRGTIALSESLANGQNTTTLRAAASIGTDFTLTLPNAVATVSNSALISDTSGNLSYARITAASAGDIAETSFTAADNQVAAANVTGLAFSNATVRSFEAQVSIVRGSTYAVYKLRGIQKAASWEMAQDYIGDSTGITFSITSAGQVQYTSTSTGSTSTLKFRAQTLTV